MGGEAAGHADGDGRRLRMVRDYVRRVVWREE